jgi:hypothetical protein
MEDSPVRFAVTVICTLVAIPLSILLDRKLHERQPGAMPYKWGYYTGLMGMMTYALLALMLLSYSVLDGRQDYAVMLLFVLAVIPYYYIIKRKRWAWVVGTILLFNPVLWIIDAVYARNRWRELDGPPGGPGVITAEAPAGDEEEARDESKAENSDEDREGDMPRRQGDS